MTRVYDATIRYAWEGTDFVLKGRMQFDDQDISGSVAYVGSDAPAGDLEGHASYDPGIVSLAFLHYMGGAVEGYSFTKEDDGGLAGKYKGSMVILPGRRDEYEGADNLERVVEDTIRAGHSMAAIPCTLDLGRSTDRKGSLKARRTRSRVLPVPVSPAVYAR